MKQDKTAAVPTSAHIKVKQRLCSGCGLCEIACSLLHSGSCQPSAARLYVEKDHLDLAFLPQVCAQCRHPACYQSCLPGAVGVDAETGARYIEGDRCTGCGDCAEACPLMPEARIIRTAEQGGRTIYFKGDLCKDRAGGPVCVEICPRGALLFRERKNR